MTSDSPSLSILSDQPADEDQLGFAPYVKTLTDILADRGTHTPLTIGVFGDWGRGKTSLMRMVWHQLEDDAAPRFPVRTIWFNAWLYSHEQALWRALIARVLDGARRFDLDRDSLARLEQLEDRLYQPLEPGSELLTLPPGLVPGLESTIQVSRSGLELWRRQASRAGEEDRVGKLEEILTDVRQSDALTRRDRLVALDDFRRQFERISHDCIVDHGRLVVFVDDLDRCLPDRAVEVLEAIKLFLDVPGCAFVLGIAREVIEEGIRVRYQDYETTLDGAQYLEKIIQIPFSLPPIAPEAVQNYVQQVTGASLPDPRCETVFSVGLEPNPRRIKRTLNIFLLLWRLAQNRDELRKVIKPVRLAKIVIIQQYHPKLFRLITDGPHYLLDLEKRFREREERERDFRERGEIPDEVEAVSAGPLQDFLGRPLLRSLLTCIASGEPDANFTGLRPDGVQDYIYLTRSSVPDSSSAEAEEEKSALSLEPQMVTIPAGKFLMGTPEGELDEIVKLGIDRQRIENEVPQHQVELAEYAIGRYPVTNAEFKRFVDDNGYQTRDYWTDAGWQHKESESWKQPRFWDQGQWNDPSQPVVGISWYEAVAYCAWLAAKTGRPYRLPTEAEWEKAARGTDGHRYPWGDDWDPKRCNNKVNGPDRATPVGQYSPDGDSLYGAGDMVGQVWEWCSGRWGFDYPYKLDDGREDLEGSDGRILRGGSWYDDNPAGICRCGCRSRNDPWFGNVGTGFRCARDSSLVL